jgi:hypothetical protein
VRLTLLGGPRLVSWDPMISSSGQCDRETQPRQRLGDEREEREGHLVLTRFATAISGLTLDLANHELAACTRFLGGRNLMDLDEVTARIIEDGHSCRSHVCGFHRKLYT